MQPLTHDSMEIPAKNSEKRRFKRLATNVDAVISIADKSTIECIILDFCEQGFFMKLKNPAKIGLQKGNSTKIYFSALLDSTKEYFQIDAQIARVADDGLGVIFDNISDNMFKALTQATNSGSIAAYSNNPRFYLNSSNQDKFKNALKRLLAAKLPVLMNEFFEDAETALEKTADHVENFKDVAAQSNLISVLRMNKETLNANYCLAITENLEFTGVEESSEGLQATRLDLSLIEKEAFEDSLNFSTLVRKTNAQFKNQLYQLELKLSYVSSFPRYLIKNPIAPTHLCEYFRQEIACIEDSATVRHTLYNAFQTTLSEHLATLYKDFEMLLAEYGAPGDFAEEIVWKKNIPTYSNTSATNKGNNFFNSSAPEQQLPTFDNAAYQYADPAYQPELMSNAYPASYTKPSTTHHVPISHTVGKLIQLINQRVSEPTNYDPGQNEEKSQQQTVVNRLSRNEYTADELLAAVSKLQVSNKQQQLPQNPSHLLESQLSEAVGLQPNASTKTISTEDKAKLEIYDQLFQALFNELTLNPNTKTYLESIKLPLMALTLQDPSFLDSEKHPARNLLNQLFSLESAVNQNKVVKDSQIKEVLDQMMARISKGSITNPDIFAKANEELKELSAPIAKSKDANIRRVIEVYDGKQRLEKARKNVQDALDKRIANKKVPSIILSLLDSGWQHLLVMSELNNEVTNRQLYLEVIDELLDWYTVLNTGFTGQFSNIEKELQFISSTLDLVCTNAFVHNKIMEELRDTLIGIGDPLVRKPVDTTFVEPKSNEVTNELIANRWTLEVDQAEVGDWFTFSLQKEAYEPLKLIWVGELPQNFIFVNRDGYKKQDLTRKELAELLQSGVVTKIENLDEPVMDRATTNMLQQMQEKLIYSVSHDPVTNLPNRKRFISLLKDYLNHTSNTEHLLCYLEIEDFRIITNVCGLQGGDQLLLQIAQLIKTKLGKESIVARLGDKTFGFLMPNVTSEQGQEIAKQIREQINKSNFVWEENSFTISIMMSLVPILANMLVSVEAILQKADSLIISSKGKAHNRIKVYQENDELLKTQTNIHSWTGRIDRIFAEKRLFSRCQMIAPIFPEKNNHSHYEILLGIRDEVGNIIPPDDFIPAVESCQRMPEVDRWVVNNVFEWILTNKQCFEKIGGFAINLSGQSLNSEDFLTFLKERLSSLDVPATKITFEVTETVAAGSLAFTKRFIKEIKQFGCLFSLDDFGTGYSSYSYLKSLDVDFLKIDGSFIKDIANSPTDMVMVNSMNEIAHSLEIQTIAEYVENMTIHKILQEIGVDYAQGWGIHKPMPLIDLSTSIL